MSSPQPLVGNDAFASRKHKRGWHNKTTRGSLRCHVVKVCDQRDEKWHFLTPSDLDCRSRIRYELINSLQFMQMLIAAESERGTKTDCKSAKYKKNELYSG